MGKCLPTPQRSPLDSSPFSLRPLPPFGSFVFRATSPPPLSLPTPFSPRPQLLDPRDGEGGGERGRIPSATLPPPSLARPRDRRRRQKAADNHTTTITTPAARRSGRVLTFDVVSPPRLQEKKPEGERE